MSDTQHVAAALTFAKRYAFTNAFGIMTGDDDNDAAKTGKEKHRPTPEWEVGRRLSRQSVRFASAVI
jgi:ERF superfamily.